MAIHPEIAEKLVQQGRNEVTGAIQNQVRMQQGQDQAYNVGRGQGQQEIAEMQAMKDYQNATIEANQYGFGSPEEMDAAVRANRQGNAGTPRMDGTGRGQGLGLTEIAKQTATGQGNQQQGPTMGQIQEAIASGKISEEEGYNEAMRQGLIQT